jgi:hypothetical protein
MDKLINTLNQIESGSKVNRVSSKETSDDIVLESFSRTERLEIVDKETLKELRNKIEKRQAEERDVQKRKFFVNNLAAALVLILLSVCIILFLNFSENSVETRSKTHRLNRKETAVQESEISDSISSSVQFPVPETSPSFIHSPLPTPVKSASSNKLKDEVRKEYLKKKKEMELYHEKNQIVTEDDMMINNYVPPRKK